MILAMTSWGLNVATLILACALSIITSSNITVHESGVLLVPTPYITDPWKSNYGYFFNFQNAGFIFHTKRMTIVYKHKVIEHELRHHRQQIFLGKFYLPLIIIPSIFSSMLLLQKDKNMWWEIYEPLDVNATTENRTGEVR